MPVVKTHYKHPLSIMQLGSCPLPSHLDTTPMQNLMGKDGSTGATPPPKSHLQGHLHVWPSMTDGELMMTSIASYLHNRKTSHSAKKKDTNLFLTRQLMEWGWVGGRLYSPRHLAVLFQSASRLHMRVSYAPPPNGYATISAYVLAWVALGYSFLH